MDLVSLECAELSVPLLEPFVIATGTMTATRSVRIRARVRHAGGEHVGIGEAAALPPVTDCDQPDLVRFATSAARDLAGLAVATPLALADALEERVPSPVLRAGVEAAVLDAWARAERVPVDVLLARIRGAEAVAPARTLVTDITIPIGAPAHMADLARAHRARGFSTFKVKVGRDLDADVAALRAIAAAVPDARFRIDANGGYSLDGARALLRAARGLVIECFEQPCARGDDATTAELARTTDVPIVADESLRGADDLARIVRDGSARGVNLKLVKLGGLVRALQIGARAQAAGLALMCGAMVETRLGLTAMMHVASALGGAQWIDLDTQLLLAAERFAGGYTQDGPTMTLTGGAGFDLTEPEDAA